MTARVAKEEMALLMPTSLSHYAPTSTQTYSDAPAAGHGLVQRLADAFRWIVELPTRRAVISELSALSDHELSDIGLSRSELSRVFDPAFIARRDAQRARGRANTYTFG
jgi:uncharacterized protein YjiS (DUF1127 family)